jgi:hypothetical protein
MAPRWYAVFPRRFSDPMIEKFLTVAEISSSPTDEADSVFAGWPYRMDLIE